MQAAELRPFKPATEIMEEIGLQVSMSTVRRRLHAEGIHHRAPAKKERLTDAHRTARVAFAQEYVAKDMEFWERTVFTDEKTFNSSCHGDNTRKAYYPIVLLNVGFRVNEMSHDYLIPLSQHCCIIIV